MEWDAQGLQPRDRPRVLPSTTVELSGAGGDDSTPPTQIGDTGGGGGEAGEKEKETVSSPDMSSSLSKFFTVLDPLRDLLADALDGGAHNLRNTQLHLDLCPPCFLVCLKLLEVREEN